MPRLPAPKIRSTIAANANAIRKATPIQDHTVIGHQPIPRTQKPRRSGARTDTLILVTTLPSSAAILYKISRLANAREHPLQILKACGQRLHDAAVVLKQLQDIDRDATRSTAS